MDDDIFECQPHLNISGHLNDMNLTEGRGLKELDLS